MASLRANNNISVALVFERETSRLYIYRALAFKKNQFQLFFTVGRMCSVELWGHCQCHAVGFRSSSISRTENEIISRWLKYVAYLTFLYLLVAIITDPGRLKLHVPERSLLCGALIADHPTTSTAVVAPDNQREAAATSLAHCDVMVWHPHRGTVS